MTYRTVVSQENSSLWPILANLISHQSIMNLITISCISITRKDFKNTVYTVCILLGHTECRMEISLLTKCSKYSYDSYDYQNSNESASDTTNMSDYYYDYGPSIYPNQTQYLKLAEFLADFTNTRNQFEIKDWFLFTYHDIWSQLYWRSFYYWTTKPSKQECPSKIFSDKLLSCVILWGVQTLIKHWECRFLE